MMTKEEIENMPEFKALEAEQQELVTEERESFLSRMRSQKIYSTLCMSLYGFNVDGVIEPTDPVERERLAKILRIFDLKMFNMYHFAYGLGWFDGRQREGAFLEMRDIRLKNKWPHFFKAQTEEKQP